jgi:3-dehydroquinate synthase
MQQAVLHLAHFPTDLRPWLLAQAYSQLVVLVDANVARLFQTEISALPPHSLCVLPAGEAYKTLATSQLVWDFMLANRVDRSALCLVIGGGMALDLGGFACAVWKRGLRFAYLPTTLLAMVDASIGGKTGVNFGAGKNLLGLFALPEVVALWPGFLQTLPPEQLRSGFAEALKQTLLADPDLWKQLASRDLAQQDWPSVIARSVEIKLGIVAQDPTENGLRKVLNFGHTIGHALESAALEAKLPLLHGEAVAWGMVAETWLSVAYAGLPQTQADDILAGICRFGFSRHFAPFAPEQLTQWLLQDKKNYGNSLKFSLLDQIGQPVYDIPVPIDAALAAIQRLYPE